MMISIQRGARGVFECGSRDSLRTPSQSLRESMKRGSDQPWGEFRECTRDILSEL